MMLAVRGWWRARSRKNRRRLVVYPSLLALASGALGFVSCMPGRSYEGALPPLDEDQKRLLGELRVDVGTLAEPGQRNMETAGSLERSAAFVESAFTRAGYAAKRLPYQVHAREVANYEATLAGGAKAAEIVVIGAHYDSASPAPGADDNASGVAAMLAISRALSKDRPARTVRFVAFVNEEPPYFWHETMGSLVYARACKARGDAIVAMLSLETVGYFRDEPGSQKYPPVVGAAYPSRGNFIGFVGDLASRGLVREVTGLFRASARFPSEGAALPAFVQGVGWSDQWSFWQVGYPGVMVTDTAPFRNPNYHTANDRPDTLDYERFARVVAGLVPVVRALAN
jgi:Peptidase family M28